MEEMEICELKHEPIVARMGHLETWQAKQNGSLDGIRTELTTIRRTIITVLVTLSLALLALVGSIGVAYLNLLGRALAAQ